MVRNRKWNRKTHLNMKFFVLFFKYNFEGFQDIITTRPQPTQVSFSASGHLLFYEPKHCCYGQHMNHHINIITLL